MSSEDSFSICSTDIYRIYGCDTHITLHKRPEVMWNNTKLEIEFTKDSLHLDAKLCQK